MMTINRKLLILLTAGLIIIGFLIYFFVIKMTKPPTQIGKITKVLAEQILFPTLSQDGENLLYFSISENKDLAFYQYSLKTKKEQKISENLDVPEKVIWSPNRDKAILKVIYDQYIFEKLNTVFKDYSLMDRQEMTWYLDFKTKKLSRLNLNIQGIDWFDNDRVVYQIYDPERYTDVLFIANADGSQAEKIKDVDFTESMGVGALSATEIYYFPNLSEAGGNNIYKLDLKTKQSSALISDFTGGRATTTINAKKILYQIFHKRNNDYTLGLINKDGSGIKDLKITATGTIDKIAWSNDGCFFVAAFKEKTMANDKFYKVEMENNAITDIRYSIDRNQNLITAESLVISPDNKTLYFTSNDLLYKLELE